MAMSNKEAAIRTIEHLPDDASLDDIIYALYVRQKIERGLRDIEAGNTVSHEEVMREYREWLECAPP
jgi:predicted transcriptional regulator